MIGAKRSRLVDVLERDRPPLPFVFMYGRRNSDPTIWRRQQQHQLKQQVQPTGAVEHFSPLRFSPRIGPEGELETAAALTLNHINPPRTQEAAAAAAAARLHAYITKLKPK
jgi:hypothetical protein